ncbi:amino acid adenylation domain-containing protein [Nostoc sp.]|uniref:amino acid adenylation domain-containing protein n=1 Tax=Nostoc sp. TaxID=1180 RepID=UPI002FF5C3F0
MQSSYIEGFKISPQQKHLWLLQQQEGDCQPYRVQCTILIEGDIKYSILERALQNIIDKYEILRTNFRALKEMTIPLQVINENSFLSINFYDFSTLELEKQLSKSKELFQKHHQLIFDWQNGSVLNIGLVNLSHQKTFLLIALPAICADMVSIHNLVREISESYSVCLHQKEFTDEPLQYADIAAWQNELFEGEDAQATREYWGKGNIFSLVTSKLPSEKPSVEKSVFKPKNINIKVSSSIVTNLEALAYANATSISTILMACWQILLWRLTGQSEMAIAMCCDGRNYEELKPALGLLAKYIPVRAYLNENSKFSEILKQLDKTITDVYQWQESFSCEDIASGDGNNQEISFFPFAFDFTPQPTKYLADEVSFSIYNQYACIDRFKMKLSCLHCDDSLTAELHYDTNLFDLEDIERLAAEFQTLLISAINNPTNNIAQLEILSPSERQQLLVKFNNTRTKYNKHQCIHQLFEQQVARTPDHPAVVFEDQQLTYTQLNARANKIAHHLQTLGVGSETIVALCVERSLEMIVGFLGILKVGGAYLALDPLLPTERLAFMLQDAKSSIILTQHDLAELFSQQEVPIVCLDTDWNAIAQQADDNPLSQTTPENLVYVVYTSGSTGQPKGVAVEHRQLLNYLHSILEKLDLPANASFATVSTFAADLGNTAIFPALCTGGCLHVISQERAMSPEAFADYCDRHPIDCLKIVPSHLNALLSASHPEKILPARLILGGEALSWKLVKKLQHYTANCQILNHYGPSEATVGVLTFMLKDETIGEKSEIVPLGRPLGNTQVYILNNHLQIVPIGVSGELFIGGDNLARGYLNHLELTSERFIPNPFSDEFGSRLYKTGDNARYLPDGNIEFLGRIDHQVKIRGFRIELGEIESVLRQHPTVRESVVLAREDEFGNKHLIAYFVPNQQSKFSVSDLQNFLNKKLPSYMVPSAFVQLKALPLTPNGKVNRQALPAPDSVKPELAGRFVLPRNSIEETIALIWSAVLKLEQVGVYDNFFELGGDSIISIQIIARLNQAGLQLTPKQLFENPTVAGLAAIAPRASTIAQQEPVTGLFSLTPIQHWFFEQKLCHPYHWNQAILLEVSPEIVPALLEQALQHLLDHHDALRLRFIPKESSWQQVNADLDEVAKVPVLCMDLSGLLATQQETTFEATATELQISLNLAEGLLMRVALFNLGDNQSKRLLLVIHHLVVDGVSWRIFLEDLQQVYQQLSQGKAVGLPQKTTSFKQWSEFLQEYAQSVQLQEEQNYWLQASRQSISRLPVDYPGGGANTVALARSLFVSLSIEETKALLQDVPAAYHTQINDVLLTALVQTLTEWTASCSVLVDLEGHGREAITDNINLSRTVGWFTTIFPVLLTLEGISQLGEALKAIKEQLHSVPNRGIGYGVLRYLSEDFSVTTQLQNLPQAEVRFNYLGQFDQVLSQSSLFKLVKGTVGVCRDLQDNRRYLLDINGFVLEGQLQMEWTYSEQIHQRTTIEHLAKGFVKALRSLIAHCQSSEVGGYTSSDFPKANLSQKDLEQLLARINRGSGNQTK